MGKAKYFLTCTLIAVTVLLSILHITYADSIQVEKLIENIGEVTYESGEQIEAASSAFDTLDDFSKQQVKNHDVLVASAETYNALVSIRNTINQVSSSGVSLDMQKDIKDAFCSYQRLDATQKKLIESPQILISANDTLASLIRVDSIIRSISSIRIDKDGWIYEEDIPSLMQTRKTFDSLTEDEKNRVYNYSDLLSYENKIPPGWGAPVLSERDYWDSVAPRLIDLLESHNLFVWDSYSIPPYFRLRVVYGQLNDDKTYSAKVIDSKEIDSLIQQIEDDLTNILYDYKLERPTSIWNEPKQSIISIDFWEMYVKNHYTGMLDKKPYSSLQIDLLDFYFGEDHPILW